MVRTRIQLPDAVYARARPVAKAKEIAADWTPPRVRSGGVKVALARLKDYGEVEATSHQPKARRRG
jgi:hypothetical protein